MKMAIVNSSLKIGICDCKFFPQNCMFTKYLVCEN